MAPVTRASLRGKLETLFGIDLRSLALFRIGVAAAILGDLLARFPDLRAFYTDEGVLPREVLWKSAPLWKFSPQFLAGSATFQICLFLLMGGFALALLLGFRTRLATFACWFLLTSLHLRNPFIHQSGDILLHLFLFWGLFLPLGARYSLDRVLAPAPPEIPARILSGASVALLLQVCFVYWFAGFNKTGDAWREGEALYRVLQYRSLSGPLGRSLLEYPGLLKFLTHFTLGLERWGPWLAFIPIYTPVFRTVAVFLFFGFHLSLALLLDLGPFPYISMAGWLAFLPGEFLDGAKRKLGGRPMGRWFDAEIFAKAGLWIRERAPACLRRPLRIGLPRWTDALALALIAYVLLLNLAAVNVDAVRLDFMRGYRGLGEALRVSQSWGMFAPEPPARDVRYEILGRLTDGSEVALAAAGGALSADAASRPARPGLRWRKYLDWIAHRIHAEYRPYYGLYLCRNWNSRAVPGEKLAGLRVWLVQESLPRPEREVAPEKSLLWEQACP